MQTKHCVSLAALAISTLTATSAFSSDAVVHDTNGRADVAEAGKTATLSDADKKFLTKAAVGNLLEVKTGKLIAAKATREDVRKFGQRMVDDHGKAYDELKALASKKGFTAPADLDDEHQKMLDGMTKLTGADLDAHYVKMMVDDHDEDVAEFKKETTKADDTDVKAFATKTLPTLESHQKAVKEIDAKMKAEKKPKN